MQGKLADEVRLEEAKGLEVWLGAISLVTLEEESWDLLHSKIGRSEGGEALGDAGETGL